MLDEVTPLMDAEFYLSRAPCRSRMLAQCMATIFYTERLSTTMDSHPHFYD
jgi:hypothetical protein